MVTFNCELSDPENNRSQILLHACPSLTYVGNDRDFTYIHQSGSVSQLDYFYCSSIIKPTSNTTVLLDYSISDHMPICNSFQVKPLPQTSPTNYPPEWLFSLNWEAANIDSYQSSCDYILSKIRIPFALLCCPNMTVESEKTILLNIYCSEITHAIHTAEKTAVPVRNIRHGTEVHNWRNNSYLLAACDSAKFSLHLWVDCGKPRSGVVIAVRVYTKRKFTKAIAQHKANEIARTSEIVDNSPLALWHFRSKNKSSSGPPCMPEKDWCDYFRDQFSAPNSYLDNTFCQALDKEFQFAVKDIGVLVTPSLMRSKIDKVKKKEI